MKIILLTLLTFLSLALSAAIKPLKTDPTQPKVGYTLSERATSTVAPTSWVLQAINISAFGRNAIINGQVYSEGQRISASTIIEKIDFGLVKLNSQGKTRVLSLNNADIKKESNAN
ncbi:hypothetical protein [Algibacillus agarilyticus]|uniref:hypothetical protein n=1 Tax=Algibacillus agarilyticus TaxID=2234133 RepID=UPI000DD0EC3E|nr:hypothetical protein [Algibacillus agarilyticus]